MFCEWWMKKQCSAYCLSPSSKVNVFQIHIPHHQLVLLQYGGPPGPETVSALPCHSPAPPPRHLQPSPLHFSASCDSPPPSQLQTTGGVVGMEELGNIVSMWVSPVMQSGHHSSGIRTNKEFHSLTWLEVRSTYWYSLISSWQIDGEKVKNSVRLYFLWLQNYIFVGGRWLQPEN